MTTRGWRGDPTTTSLGEATRPWAIGSELLAHHEHEISTRHGGTQSRSSLPTQKY